MQCSNIIFRLINLYQKWGHGGYGVVLPGNIIVDQNHIELPGNMIVEKSLDSEERRRAFRALAESAKADGTLVIGQINHSGRQTPANFNPHPYSASDVQLHGFKRAGLGFGKPVPLTVDQIKNEVKCYR